MGNKKIKNLFFILMVMLVIIGIPYLLYLLGSLIAINYFGYINNWWIVLLFIFILISVYILRAINFEKYMAHFFLLLITGSFFILGIRFGVKPNVDMELYAQLVEKEREIDYLDSIKLELDKNLFEVEAEGFRGFASFGSDFKNHEIVFFTPGNADLSDYHKSRITTFISSIENCHLNINGYSDNSGTQEFNLDISNQRAKNVADFITSIQNQSNVINRVVGYGSEDQLVKNDDQVSRAINRRVTIEIVGKIDGAIDSRTEKIQSELRMNREEVKRKIQERDSLRAIVFQVGED